MGKETDVYSWGVLLWEMSSGARAWANLRYAQVGLEALIGACDASCAVLMTSCMPRWVRGLLGACQRLLCYADALMHAQVGRRYMPPSLVLC